MTPEDYAAEGLMNITIDPMNLISIEDGLAAIMLEVGTAGVLERLKYAAIRVSEHGTERDKWIEYSRRFQAWGEENESLDRLVVAVDEHVAKEVGSPPSRKEAGDLEADPYQRACRALDELILSTPTGSVRGDLTQANIFLKIASANARMMKANRVAVAVENPGA